MSAVVGKQSWDEEHFVAAVQQKVSECAHCVSTFGETFRPLLYFCIAEKLL